MRIVCLIAFLLFLQLCPNCLAIPTRQPGQQGLVTNIDSLENELDCLLQEKGQSSEEVEKKASIILEAAITYKKVDKAIRLAAQ